MKKGAKKRGKVKKAKKPAKRKTKKAAKKTSKKKRNSVLHLRKRATAKEGIPEAPSPKGSPESKKTDSKKTYLRMNIPGFDELFEKGTPLGKATLIEGSPGTGKTIFCLQAGYNFCMQNKKVLYMSFEESEESLKSHMKEFGWNPDEMEKKGLFKIKRFSAIDVARSVEALLSEAKRELLISAEPIIFPKDFDPEIVMIDSLSSIASAFSGENFRFRVFMEQLFRFLEERVVSSFLIKESPQPTHIGSAYSDPTDGGGAISFLSDGIICLYNVVYPGGDRGNAIEVLKMRGVNFKKVLVVLEITEKGIVVHPEQKLGKNYILS